MAVASLSTSRPETVASLRLLGSPSRLLLWGAIVGLVIYPIVMVLMAAIDPAASGSQAVRLSDLASERLIAASVNTLKLGMAVSVMSLAIGTAIALLALHTRRERWIDIIMSVPFLTPPFLASLAWSLSVGPKGYISRFGLSGDALETLVFSFWGLSLLMSVHYAPLVYFAVRAQMAKIPTSLLWAAQIAGAGPRQIIMRILLPISFPALTAGAFLAFACAIEEYGTPLVIGNRIGFPVISTEIGRIASVYPINLTLASALASILFALGGAIYFFSYLLQRHARTSAKPSSYPFPNLLSARVRTGLWLLLSLYFIFTFAIPYGAMLMTSLLKLISAGPTLDNLTVAHYLDAMTVEASGLRDALIASFSLAVTAAALGAFLGAASVRKSPALASLALIPAATPAITMAVGFILAWNGPWTAWLPLYGSALIVGLFYTVLCLPYAVQYARAGIASIPPSYEWAARIHGARPGLITRKIVAPLLWPHCLAGAILIFSISFRELIGSVLLRPPGMQTVSTFILREFDQGSPAAGMAMGVIAIAVSMLAICRARQLVPKRP
jgi:iron(III) transport system permease protein